MLSPILLDTKLISAYNIYEVKLCKKGDIVYIHDNRYGLSKAQIIKCNGNIVTIRLVEHKSGYAVPSHRLMTEDEMLAKYGNQNQTRPLSPPYLH